MTVADNINIINLADYRPRPALRIQRQRDPLRPNRIAYRITGESCSDVQHHIDGLIAEVEMHLCGYGRFIGPHHIGKGIYVALGEIVLLHNQP